MTKWRCSHCGYVLEGKKPPENGSAMFTIASPPSECPDCREKCAFADVTCYTPECGGEQNIDPQLLDHSGEKPETLQPPEDKE